ncbi:polysaccharide deacetylase family protein [Candidatus Latescibacterota bacterium]
MFKLKNLSRIILFAGFAILIISEVSAQYKPGQITFEEKESFHWPEGKRAAVSLSFDDARLSQIDVGMPLFDKYGVNATFYVLSDNVKKNLEGWKKAHANGHEIGNHTLSHPCTGNFDFSRDNALEMYDLDLMSHELDGANAEIEQLLGVKPVTFAYPCGQKFVGKGVNVKSYIPLVAERFIAGRGYLGESANDPIFCDLAQVIGIGFDNVDAATAIELLEQAAAEGRWLILAGHEIGDAGFQTTYSSAIESICNYALDVENGIWIDTVETVGRYVMEYQNSVNDD